MTAALIFHQLGYGLRLCIKNINYGNRMEIQDRNNLEIQDSNNQDLPAPELSPDYELSRNIEGDNGVIHKYSLKESSIKIDIEGIKPTLKGLSENDFKTIYEEADSMCKKVKEEFQKYPNWKEESERSGSYVKIPKTKNIVR